MKLLKFFWEKWKIFAIKFGEFMSGVILTLFYFVIVSPHAIFVKWFSDPLQTKHKVGWQKKKTSVETIEKANRQY